MFVARETARDAAQLARQMARSEVKSASVAWATREEVQQAQRARERQAVQSERQRVRRRSRTKAADFWRELAEEVSGKGLLRRPAGQGAQHPGGAADGGGTRQSHRKAG